MKTVRDILFDAADRSPDALALADGARCWNYAELLDCCRRLASGLLDLGLVPGDRVAVAMTNCAELAMLHWAGQISGLVVTPLNWRVGPSDLDYFLADSGARAIVFETTTQDAVAGSVLAGSLIRISVEGSALAQTSFETLTRRVVEGSDGSSTVEGDTISVLLYTSGTTGPGKGVPRSHVSERAAAIAHVAQSGVLFGDRTLGVMPLYHTMGVRLLLAMGLVSGAFICQRRFDPDEALHLIRHHQINGLYLVPTLFHDLLAVPQFTPEAVASVRKLGFAGAPMTDGLLRRLQVAFAPEMIVNHYGSSEIYTFTVDQQASAKPGSAGRAGINASIKVVETGAGRPDLEVGPGVEGEIIASLGSDEAFSGYWSRPDADARALRDGWYFTGDVGYFDDDGDLFVIGRVDDMMISGGENVLPVEIESVLSLHGAVAEVAVVGLPDERMGHRITAFVVRAAPVEAADLDEWCLSSGLARFKRPRDYIFTDTIPKSPVGKIIRRRLVEAYVDGVARVNGA